MHEEPGHGAIAGVCSAALEQRAADAATTMAGEHGQPQFRVVVKEREMRDAHENEIVIVDDENSVPLEIDAIDVRGDPLCGKRGSEPQVPIVRGQREEVLEQRGTRVFGKALDSDRHFSVT